MGTVELEPEVRDWLEELSAERFATATFYIDLLAEQGPLLGEPYTRQLDGKLRELRLHLDRSAVRVTYWIARGRRIVRLRRTTMGERSDWAAVRERRLTEPGAAEAYLSAKLAYELGRRVRELRERREWTQTELATAAGMTQSAIARFEAGGTVPTLPVLHRLAEALDANLVISVTPRTDVA